MEIETDISKVTSSEAIRIHQMEREDAARVERVTFGESPLNSLEATRFCCGWNLENCGNELDPGELELCAPCQAKEDRFYREREMARDGHEPIVFYPHLTD